jgi:hypothetical protein
VPGFGAWILMPTQSNGERADLQAHASIEVQFVSDLSHECFKGRHVVASENAHYGSSGDLVGLRVAEHICRDA